MVERDDVKRKKPKTDVEEKHGKRCRERREGEGREGGELESHQSSQRPPSARLEHSERDKN